MTASVPCQLSVNLHRYGYSTGQYPAEQISRLVQELALRAHTRSRAHAHTHSHSHTHTHTHTHTLMVVCSLQLSEEDFEGSDRELEESADLADLLWEEKP